MVLAMKKDVRRCSAAALVAASLVAGCAPAARTADPSPYFPMEADRGWEYRLDDIGRGAAWRVGVRSRGPKFVPELGRIVVIFDEEYPDQVLPVAFFLSEGFLQSAIGLGYAADRRMGVMPIGAQPMRLMPVPPQIGRRWSYLEDVFGAADAHEPGLAIEWSGVVHGQETVSVPAGTFRRCLRVESVAAHRIPMSTSGRHYRYVDWYAPGVGLVKSEYSLLEPESPVTRMELVSFHAAPLAPRPAPDMAIALTEPRPPA